MYLPPIQKCTYMHNCTFTIIIIVWYHICTLGGVGGGVQLLFAPFPFVLSPLGDIIKGGVNNYPPSAWSLVTFLPVHGKN